MHCNLVMLPGDGIGPEVTAEAVKILKTIAQLFGHSFSFAFHKMGGNAIDELGTSLPEETVVACLAADAVFLGAVGGPKWDDPRALDRPERGLLAIRQRLELFANLRPVKLSPHLVEASPLRAELVQDVDLLVIRELTGGIYFGEKVEPGDGATYASDLMAYSAPEIERVVRLAAQRAMERNGYLVSVDKANVLASSRLWRQIATRTLAEFEDLRVEHVLVDAMAMHLVNRPGDFDVIVCSNLFGDILTDEASVLGGSMGMLPSASLGMRRNSLGEQLGLYEPIHGSAPDIMGQDKANPLAAILSCALMCRMSLGLSREADAIEVAVEKVLGDGMRTLDIEATGSEVVTTQVMGDLVKRVLTAACHRN